MATTRLAHGRFHDPAAHHGDHGAEPPLECEAAGGESQPRGQDAVVRAGRPAPLKVAQHHRAGFDPRLLLNSLGDHAADAAQPRVAERVGMIAESQGALVGKLAPSATITMPYFLPAARRCVKTPTKCGRSIGTSGTRM